MKQLTKRVALEGCIELWDWLAENPECHKCDWSGWGQDVGDNWDPTYKDYGSISSYCFACEYGFRIARKSGKLTSRCDYCPLEWTGTYCTSPESEYDLWAIARRNYCSGKDSSRKSVIKHAKAIADLARKALWKLPKLKEKKP